MARIHDVIEDLLGDRVTEDDIKEAFRLDHPDYKSHPMAEEQNGGVLIHGDFNTSNVQCSYVGYFERYIYRSGGVIVAEHRNIFIEKPYRKQKIARNHIGKLLPFYDQIGIEYVHLQAVDYGPPIWPQFGFEISDHKIRELVRDKFRRLTARLGYEVEPPEQTPRLATAPPIDGIAVGITALRLVYEEDLDCQPIVMVLDLKDTRTREYLAGRGILLT